MTLFRSRNIGRIGHASNYQKLTRVHNALKQDLARAEAEIERLRAEVKTQRNRIASLKGLIEDEEEAERQ